MGRLEDNLMPRETASSWRRDVLIVATLVGLWCFLMPGAGVMERLPADFSGQLASPFLLMTLGFLLALRRGAIDLSVWAGAALGGIVSAWLILRLGSSAPDSPRLVALCLLAGAGAGAALGAVNGLLVAYAGLPSLLVTLVTAAITVGALNYSVSGRSLHVKDNTFSQWYLSPDLDEQDLDDMSAGAGRKVSAADYARPLSATRVILVGSLFVFTLVAIAMAGQIAEASRIFLTVALVFVGILAAEILGVYCGRTVKVLFWAVGGVVVGASAMGGAGVSRWSSRAHLLTALIASGFFAGSAGALWLLDQGSTPVPSAWRVVDDLRVPAAAVMAGAWLLSGRRRTLLAVALLPAALLLTTNWQVRVWNLSHGGLCLQNLVLLALLLTIQVSFSAATESRRLPKLAWTAMLFAIFGLAAMTLGGQARSSILRESSRYAGLVLGVVSAGMMVIWKIHPARERPAEFAHGYKISE